ncbi:type II toxin-antitoxin system VapC family toxin [Thiorhodovibrio frisius]|uniref:Putative nucleic acid-binding protein n=1 Tax=Thiorhodovibrio frisius TaxID=631362 RepID=H8Z2V4_9GAMM|nr:type II toxin-antitoxin system VapC family toxin [Thiorhodovibrio frisius]EIC21690.1 putative nucleic acid-binding protein [Thiorhodovibrio frisius]WPL21658.1 putative ribonuclease FitB [Thiorhodovibrio frisius]
MFLLDINVVSEWMKPSPDQRVIEWLDAQPAKHLYFPAVVKAEIESGIALLPDGKRKAGLQRAAQVVIQEFSSRCLPLDCAATVAYAKIRSQSKIAGRPMSVEDAQIAAIASENSLALVTRNVADFDFLADLRLVNPWQDDRAQPS